MRIFLSYSRSDAAIAEEIALTLRQAGHKVFFDQHEIQAAEDFNRVIWGEIRKADLFVFLISPDAVAPGSYAQTELGFAERRWPNPERRVLPVMVEPTGFDTLPVYATICHILSPKGDIPAEVRAEVGRLARRHRWVQMARLAVASAVLVALGVGGYLGYRSYLERQPLAAQATLAALGVAFEANRFVDGAYRGHLNVVNLFLEAGMHPDTPSDTAITFERPGAGLARGSTPLMAAALGGRTEVVDRLLAAGADRDARDSDGHPAAFHAVLAGHEQLFRRLQRDDAPQALIDALFETAATGDSEGHRAIMRWLLADKGSVDAAMIDRAFVLAARAGDFAKMDILAARIADKSKTASAALVDVSGERQHWEGQGSGPAYSRVIDHLLTLGADVNAVDGRFAASLFAPADGDVGWTPLLKAVAAGDKELIRILLEKGADPNVACKCPGVLGGGWTPFLLALKRGLDSAVVEWMMEHGADVDTPWVRASVNERDTPPGRSPLMLAAGRPELVRWLLDRGAEVNVAANDGQTALFAATAAGSRESVAILLASGADVDVGHNPLLATVSAASRADGRAIAGLLIEAGADLDKPSREDGQTVLMRAIRSGDPDVVRFFVEAGAAPGTRDREGRSALMLARRTGNEEIVALVERALGSASNPGGQ